ncbi:hypothetical protein [Methylobacterium sp. Leaf85]|uniref:hypothetical protein n=1 Tax=Methylobacterium sp. Leaf85 TaxID=1736241 RepID=UPI0006F29940|nr:hypothetical protein [Methylobacterium sp. Leaf85]KQO49753.1 hypothetical protein ASF08_22935 [Methylobacterium sp. Leaf85]
MADALTQIEDAFRARIKAAVPGLKRVLTPEELPVKDAHLPAAVVGLGNELIHDYLVGEPGDRIIERHQQVDVIVVLDEGREDFKAASRALTNQVRAALADPRALGIEVEDVRLVSSQPQTFQSEKGSQGGFLLAFLVQYVSPENDPATIFPRQ